MQRRDFITQMSLTGIGIVIFPSYISKNYFDALPVKAITNAPNYHWFGYYDKEQLDPQGKYALGMEVDFRFRSPSPDDVIDIGLLDLENNYKWEKLGESKSWGWQQGCMLQWRPGSNEEIIWNDREGDHFVSHILNIRTGNIRTLPKAIYALSPNGNYAIGTEFSRIQNMRPGYGYPGIKDPYIDIKAPEDIGIYRMDLNTGATNLIISLAEVAEIPHFNKSLKNYWHYFNHLLVSPDSERFIFLHRCRENIANKRGAAPSGGFSTRMFTANKYGEDKFILDPSGHTSHFIWRDSKHICTWTKPVGKNCGFYLFEDKTHNIQPIGHDQMIRNGHISYLPLPGKDWILNDTYPNEDRKQTLYLYHVPTQRKIILGKFYSPPKYQGEWRCDLHPRSSQDGTKIIFDSTHEGKGRQMYMIDISEIAKE